MRCFKRAKGLRASKDNTKYDTKYNIIRIIHDTGRSCQDCSTLTHIERPTRKGSRMPASLDFLYATKGTHLLHQRVKRYAKKIAGSSSEIVEPSFVTGKIRKDVKDGEPCTTHQDNL